MDDWNASAGSDCHESAVEVRYAETDQMGYAHHTCAVTWFELGRVRWLRECGAPYKELEERGILMPVIRITINYQRPAKFEDQLILQTRLVELGRSRLSFQNRVLRETPAGERERVAEGQIDLACVGPDGRVKRLPEDLRERLGRRLVRSVPDAGAR